MNKLKVVLSVIALACMVGFIIAVLVLIFGSRARIVSQWILALLTAFLAFGSAALVIDRLQKRAVEKQQAAEKPSEGGNS